MDPAPAGEGRPTGQDRPGGLLLPAVSLGLWHNVGSDPDADGRRSILRRIAEVPAGTVRTRACAGWAGTTSTSSPPTAPTRAPRSRRRWEHCTLPSGRGSPATSGSPPTAGSRAVAAATALTALDTAADPPGVLLPLFHRTAESGLLATLDELGVGSIAFSPQAQGLLTDRYLDGIPANSRAAGPSTSLDAARITESTLATLRTLDGIAAGRGQTVAQLEANAAATTGPERRRTNSARSTPAWPRGRLSRRPEP